jgi:hypothetical protein
MNSTSFGRQQNISTPSGGWARYSPALQRYDVGSRMWSNGGGSLVGYARNAEELTALLETAELESLHSKERAIASGASFAQVPSGYAVNDLGDVVLVEDL